MKNKLPLPILHAKHKIIQPYCQIVLKFHFFGKSTIRHIQTVIRHMWRVANGLDNAGLEGSQRSQKQSIVRF